MIDCRALSLGRVRHRRNEVLIRHRHALSFAAVVVSGGYVEAGDTGLHRVSAGDVIVHQPYENHIDRIGSRGADVVVVPLGARYRVPSLGRVCDPDRVGRIAKRSLAEAADYLLERTTWREVTIADWPDLLAAALREDLNLIISDWARTQQLHPGSISRGFQRQFGVAPATFRATLRGQKAVYAIVETSASFVGIAFDCGFADQAHMSRAVRAVTGCSPKELRRNISPKI